MPTTSGILIKLVFLQISSTDTITIHLSLVEFDSITLRGHTESTSTMVIFIYCQNPI